MDLQLTKKIALVTGSTAGIGNVLERLHLKDAEIVDHNVDLRMLLQQPLGHRRRT